MVDTDYPSRDDSGARPYGDSSVYVEEEEVDWDGEKTIITGW